MRAWACGFNGGGQLAAPPSPLCWTQFEELSAERARVRAATWAQLVVVVGGGGRERDERDERDEGDGRERDEQGEHDERDEQDKPSEHVDREGSKRDERHEHDEHDERRSSKHYKPDERHSSKRSKPDGAETVRWFGHVNGGIRASGVRQIAATPAWLWILRHDGRLEARPWSEAGGIRIVAEGCKAFGVGEHVGAIVNEDGRLRMLDPTLCTAAAGPLEIGDGALFVQVVCGPDHAVAVTAAGTVYSWGAGGHGQLGHGDTKNVGAPVRIEALADVCVRAAACGTWHTLFVSDTGDLYSCGWDSHGQLGSGGESDLRINRALPNAVDLPDENGILSADVAVAQAAAGSAHSAVLTTDGRIVTFGFGKYGQLGLDGPPVATVPLPTTVAWRPPPNATLLCGPWQTFVVTGL